MDKLLKKIADFSLGSVAILGLLAVLPLNINGVDILIIGIGILFLSIIILIISHTSKLEKEINEINKNFKINERLNKLEIGLQYEK